LNSWSEAYPIISSAKKSIVIIDSFLAGEILDVAEQVEKAATGADLAQLRVSLLMASPKMPFGAQRIREKELPEVATSRKLPNAKKTLDRFGRALSKKISPQDLERHVERFEQSIYEVLSHIANVDKVQVEILTYPAMITARFFVIDDRDFLVGWFPLMGANPGYPCCYLRDATGDPIQKELIGKFRRQVAIFRGISKKLTEREIRSIIRRRTSVSSDRSGQVDTSAVLYR
jgi:hypothetical protein